MNKKCVNVSGAPPAAGPYSHAVISGGFVFVSGQVAIDPTSGSPRKGSFEEEARLALANLKTILEGCGTDLAHVVKITVYLADMGNFSAFNALYKEYFPSDFPARTCIQAGRLPLDFQVEVEAIAELPQ